VPLAQLAAGRDAQRHYLDARLWPTNAAADDGPLQAVSNHTIRLDRIRALG
jgi:hypothetical protein